MLFFCFISLFVWGDEPQKIICLVSPPRSLSVGFLRMMEARGDFKIYHEPTISVYHRVNGLRFSDDWFREGAFQTFDEVKEAIFNENSNVFVKEMSFSLNEVIDEDFMKRPNVYFVFLFRNPHDAIVSFYKKLGRIVEDFQVACGYKAAHEVFHKIIDSGARRPLVLSSEELGANPEKVVKTFCDYVGIPFIEQALSWENLGSNFGGYEEWHETKRTDHTQHWHGEAIQSTKFVPLKSYEVDDKGNPTFSEIKSLEDRKECEKAYLTNLPYYLFFKGDL